MPVALFTGPSFEYDNNNKRLRNLLTGRSKLDNPEPDFLDMFNRNIYLEEIDIIMGTRLVVSVIADEKYIHFRFYTSRLLPSDLKKG